MIPLLEPLFQGPLRPHGEALRVTPEPPADAVRVQALFDSPARLLAVLGRHAAHLDAGPRDLRPVASVWTLHYLAALMPPFAAAASVLEHVFPVEAQRTWVRVNDHGIPFAFHIRGTGSPMPGAATAARYAPLLTRHLQPLFDALAQATRVAPKILWGNAARHLEPILAQALALAGGAATVARDKRSLLDDPAWWPGGEGPTPGPCHNPMHAPRQTVGSGAAAIRLHRQCCLSYLLPQEGYCGACPLAPANRPLKSAAPFPSPSPSPSPFPSPFPFPPPPPPRSP